MEHVVTKEGAEADRETSLFGLFSAVLRRDLMLAYRKKSDLFNPPHLLLNGGNAVSVGREPGT